MTECNKCDKEKEINELKEKVDELDKRLYAVEGDRKVLEVQFAQIMTTLSELKVEFYELRKLPSKRWEHVIMAIITAIIGLVVGKFI